MPVIPENAISQIGELPVVVAVLLIATAAIIGVVWIGSRILQQRDTVFMKFFGDQRDMDRTIGKLNSETSASALGKLADAIRDNGTATLAMIQGMSDKVDQAMDANTDAIRSSNNLIASLGRDIDELLRRHREEEQDRRGSKR